MSEKMTAVLSWVLAVALAIVVGIATASAANADQPGGHYPPTCVDCETAETGGDFHLFADTGLDPLKAAAVLGVIGTCLVVVARRRRA